MDLFWRMLLFQKRVSGESLIITWQLTQLDQIISFRGRSQAAQDSMMDKPTQKGDGPTLHVGNHGG